MTWKRLGLIALSFVAGFASIAQAWQNPQTLLFDWASICTGLTFAGLANARLSDSSLTVQIVTTVCAGLFGYGMAEIGFGYRYALHFDFRAVYPAILATGLIHANNINVTQPLAATVARVTGEAPPPQSPPKP